MARPFHVEIHERAEYLEKGLHKARIVMKYKTVHKTVRYVKAKLKVPRLGIKQEPEALKRFRKTSPLPC